MVPLALCQCTNRQRHVKSSQNCLLDCLRDQPPQLELARPSRYAVRMYVYVCVHGNQASERGAAAQSVPNGMSVFIAFERFRFRRPKNGRIDVTNPFLRGQEGGLWGFLCAIPPALPSSFFLSSPLLIPPARHELPGVAALHLLHFIKITSPGASHTGKIQAEGKGAGSVLWTEVGAGLQARGVARVKISES